MVVSNKNSGHIPSLEGRSGEGSPKPSRTCSMRDRVSAGLGRGFPKERLLGAISTASRLDDLIANRIPNQFADRMKFQFPHDVRAVSLGSLDTNSERHCDFFAAFSFCEQLHDLPFARGKTAPYQTLWIGRRIRPAESVEQHVSGTRGEK